MNNDQHKENAIIDKINKEPKKIEYTIIVENYTSHLSERVNQMLKDGWELQGGINGHTSISTHNRSGTVVYVQTWAQALIKK